MKIVASMLMISALFANVVAPKTQPTGQAFHHYAVTHRCGHATSRVRWFATHGRQSFQRCGSVTATYTSDRSTRPTATTTATASPTVRAKTPTTTATAEPTSTRATTAVAPTAPPRPTATAPAARPTSTLSPQPTATPHPSPLPLDPTPTSTPPASADLAYFLLSLLNAHRLAAGVPPLTLNLIQSKGTASCVGSLGHSEAMQQSGSIWHTNPNYPAASFPNNLCVFYTAAGENVGNAGGSELQAIQSIDALMMSETPNTPLTCGITVNHACNIVSPRFTQLGVGIVYVNNIVWLTTDFLN